MSKKEIKNLNFPLSIEKVNEGGNFAGYASVFGKKDSHNDIILKGAFKRTLFDNDNGRNVKLLWQHNAEEPIGYFSKIIEDDYGLYVEAKLLLDLQKGKEAYSLLKNNVVEGLSIGFTAKDYQYDEFKNIRYLKEIELFEISLVTFPANNAAQITYVKNSSASRDEYLEFNMKFQRAMNILKN